MFGISQSNSRTPESFRKSARDHVLKNLSVTQPQNQLQQSNLFEQSNNNNNNNAQDGNLLHYSFKHTSPVYESRRSNNNNSTTSVEDSCSSSASCSSSTSPSPSSSSYAFEPVVKRMKPSTSFLAKLRTPTMKKKYSDTNTDHSSLSSTKTSPTSNPAINSPLSRSSSRSSLSNNSIFSTNSNFSNSSSISEYSFTPSMYSHSPDYSKVNPNNHSQSSIVRSEEKINHNNKLPLYTYSYQSSQNQTRYVKFAEILDEINNTTPNFHNIGKVVFDELNKIINSSNTTNPNDVNQGNNTPDKLIDWSLNFIRLLMFVNDPKLLQINQELKVDLNAELDLDSNGKSSLVSELIKAYDKSTNHAFNSTYFLEQVMNPQLLSFLQTQGSAAHKLELKIEKVPINCSDIEFQKILIHSDLFCEFSIDLDFKVLLSKVSIEKARDLQFKSGNSSSYLTDDFKAIALRNYFLNLLVASQTLFEYHYSLSSILIPNQSQTANHFKHFNENDKKWLWDSIRERNFDKIKIFNV